MARSSEQRLVSILNSLRSPNRHSSSTLSERPSFDRSTEARELAGALLLRFRRQVTRLYPLRARPPRGLPEAIDRAATGRIDFDTTGVATGRGRCV